ncbi:MAG: Hsp20/alpha crystallin family protein [Myxococcota bacterium]
MAFGFFDSRSNDLWAEFDRLRSDLDGSFRRLGARRASPRGLPFPPVNLYEVADGYVLTAEVPGLDKEELDVSVEGNRVTLRGERRIDAPEEGMSVHRCERQEGSLRRTVELPTPLDPEKAQAVYRNGVLEVRLPKASSHQPRRIDVHAS